ncbi:MAG: D-alanine--D-alanine ligase [bacterium]|nr:D-alanine--D-alanine ligase [bacterium]
MKQKIKVGIIFGGKSAEHEVSLQSAKNIIAALDKEKYESVLVGIDKEGRWHLADDSEFLLHAEDPKLIALNKSAATPLTVSPGDGKRGLVAFPLRKDGEGSIDVLFPVLHGPFGEDGTVQGLLKLLDVPFVGAGVLGSAVGMDKDVAKRLFRDAGIPTAKFIAYRASGGIPDFDEVEKLVGLPLFVKPANLGSSVGIHKVKNKNEFTRACQDAFQYDEKILVEEFINGREIECAVLGNDDPIASLPGEVIPRHEFYSYEAKYIDEQGATLQIPVKLPPAVVKKIQQLALRAFKALCLEGMARVDFFLRNGTEALINEVNTIPGFTNISMYPKLWEASGLSYAKLIDKLIELAMERHEKEKKLKTSVG